MSLPRRWRRLTALGLAAVIPAGCSTPPTVKPSGAVSVLPPGLPAAKAAAPTPPTVVPASNSEPTSPPAPAQPDGPVLATEVIDLGTALGLAGVGNPTIGLAREAVREAQARELAARSLLLPSLSAGTSLNVHRGVLQRSTGQLLAVDRQSLYLGGGAQAVGGGTVGVPGVRLFAHLGDAALAPLAARQRVMARLSDEQAVQNAVLLDVAVRYLQLVGADARVEVLRRAEGELAEVVRLTAEYARAGQGRRADANRADANAATFRRRTQQAEEEAAVAAARLGELLNLDPAVQLRPPPGAVPLLRLVDESTPLDALIAQALAGRPELSARSAAVAEAQTRVRQEKVRPWLPVVSAGFSAGGFGGGSNLGGIDFSPLRGRTDFDVSAVWAGRNLGFSNRALARRAEAVVGQAVAELDRTTNTVRAEVATAKADAETAGRRMEIAARQLAIAEEGFALGLARIKQGEGRPLEVLDGFRQLADSRLEAVRATVEFDAAQFGLWVALGLAPAVPLV